MKKGMLKSLGAFVFAAALTLSSVTVMAGEQPEMSTTAGISITDEKTGITLSSSSVSEDIQTIFDGIELNTEKVSDEEQENYLKDALGDKYAEVELYNVEVSSVNPETLPDIQSLTKTAKLSIPLSGNMNSEWTRAYFVMEGTIGWAYRVIEENETGAAIVISLQNDYNNTDKNKITCQYAVMRHSIPTETKDWEQVAEDYIQMIRYTDWFTGDEIDRHFYKETAAADDVAAVTLFSGNDYSIDGPYYNEETGRIEIPYDVFAAHAAELFVNVPDLKSVNNPNLIQYEASINAMCRPFDGGGNAPLITEVVSSIDLGDGRYAVQFKVSRDEIGEDGSMPDLSNENNYTKCTLTVEDGGKGNWKYVSFEEGYTTGTPKPEEPAGPENPGDAVDQVIEEINNAQSGTSVAVDMGAETVVSQDILSAAKGKDVDVVFEMDGYTWTVNGKDITAEQLKDIDLSVTMDSGAIPDSAVDKLAGDKPVRQISLAHEGTFGFKAELKIFVGGEYSGKYGNLFWYTDEKFQYIDSDVVAADGYVVFEFTHASDYIIVMNDTAMSQKDVTAGTGSTGTAGKAPQTGDVTNVTMYIVFMFATLTAVLTVYKKKSN